MTVGLLGAGRTMLVASATAIALLLSGSAYAGDQRDNSAADRPSVPPPAGTVAIAVASSNGSGCPRGTAEVNVLPDNAGFTVTYHSKYLAWAGVGADPTDFRKNCQVNLQVDRPDGYTYAIVAGRHRGVASLLSGSSGLQRWSYYFQGSSATRAAEHRFTGPYGDDWATSDRFDAADLVWSPCYAERNLNVNTELRVAAGTSEPDAASFMAVDWSDDRVDAAYRFVWKACP
jgi:hypothetical protein